jgi:abortive infection bacteriophage resistance protein
MLTIVNMYDVEVKVKEDLESIVPLAWNNRDEFKKANKGDKSTYKNKYVENVNKTASDVRCIHR